METDFYKLQLDPAKGGIISSLYAKKLQKEFCGAGERSFHEFRGYFIEEKAWHSSTEQPATLETVEQGPLRVTVAIAGKISSVPFRTTISLTQGQRRIDFHTQFRFDKDTWIGDTWQIKPAQRMTGRRRSEYDDRYKLLALFPVLGDKGVIYKNSAFDVCRSANVNTFFNSWDTIKHNIILNWVDLVDESSNTGIALLSDHTTSYAHGADHPLSLVMGWGWDGGFWWGKCPLNGLQETRYAIVPHSGTWKEAAVWTEENERSEPLLSRVAFWSDAASKDNGRSLIEIETPGVHLSAMNASGRDLLIRLFNAESDEQDHTIRLAAPASSIELVELDGRHAAPIHSERDARGYHFRITIPRFGVKTVRLHDVVR
jgi:alpha-mannosidase